MYKYANVEMWITYSHFCVYLIFFKYFICLTILWIMSILPKILKSNYSMEIKNLTPLMLAFVGDAVHTLYVREHVISSGLKKINDYHKYASKFCCATFQSKVLDKLFDKLSEEEKDLIRRTRNTKIHHSAKNSSSAEYKKATCFEALIGYLYISNNKERLNEFLKISMEEM